MRKRTQSNALAEYTQAQREHAVAQREAIAARAAIAAARASVSSATLRPTQATEPSTGSDLRARKDTLSTAGKTLAALEVRRQRAERLQAELANRMAAAREKALKGESGFELLAGAHPLLLLPVRLEARFARLKNDTVVFDDDPTLERVLLVRIYPDEIHEDVHEPEFTPDEGRWAGEFKRKLLAARDNPPIRDAWAELIARAGPTRAAWLGQIVVAGLRADKRTTVFSRSALARLLPDRWVAFAELDDESTLTAMSAPVREPLEMGPSPDGMQWMVDFELGMKVGMALIVRGIRDHTDEVVRLTVVGARATLDPAQAQAELVRLLDAHRYTRGLELLAPGTPTNSTPAARAGYSTRPEAARVIDIEQRRFRVGGRAEPLCQDGDQTDGTALALALGVDASTFAFVGRADGTDQQDAYLLRSVLVAATRRPLTRWLDGIVDAQTVDDLLVFAVERVSALGPLPTLRVGSQPYAVLPVMLRDVKRFPTGSSAQRFLPVLERLRAVWRTATKTIDRVGQAGADPGKTLLRILQRDGVLRRVALRPVLGPLTGAAVAAGLTGRAAADLRAQQQTAAAAIDALGARRSSASPLLKTLHLPMAPSLAVDLVQPADALAASAQRAAAYLETVAALRPDHLMQHDYGGGERPRALLFAIARLAMLEQADAWARALLIAAGANPQRWDDEEVPSLFVDALASPLRRLQSPDPADPLAPIAFHLSEAGRDAGVLGTLRNALRQLKQRPPEMLELQLRASLGLFSHRLDAWYTALATEQLLSLRNEVGTQTGLNIGGWGVLEHIVPAPRRPVAGSPGLFSDPANGGYVHAPSVNQGVAAAVLRSVHLAHSAAGRGTAFSVDLSSERVRHALELLEGVRGGQPLSALLGYRIERALGAERLQRFIAPLRSVAPLLANTLTPSTQPADSVAASNVVDGLALLAESGYDGEQAASVDRLWQRHASLGALPSGPEHAALQRVLSAAEDAIDAVSDLVLAESVYQAVQGNPVRAGAAADSTSGAPVPPSEPTIVRTPRTGIAATHRLLVLTGDTDVRAASAKGWGATPRAIAEPRLEAWASTVLPTPSQIRVRARFVAADGSVAATLDNLTLAALHEAAEDRDAGYLQFAALDLVALADPQARPQRSALEVRLMALVECRRPVDLPASARLELVYERPDDLQTNEFLLADALEIAMQLRDSIGHARPLAPADLTAPGQSPSLAIDQAELGKRAQKAADELAAVRSALDTLARSAEPAALREALFAADALGVVGAAPASLRDAAIAAAKGPELAELHAQAAACLAELARRSTRLNQATADGPVARLKAVFGEAFVVLPLLVESSAATAAFVPGARPDGASAAATRTWLSSAARVREGARLFDSVLGCAEAVAFTQKRGTLPQFHVGQLGGPAGERWIALPLAAGTTLPGGRVSLVAATSGVLPGDTVAGLFVDEWVEVLPNPEETTSVAFHYDAPSSAAPQVLLLGVPQPGVERWTADAACGLVAEAIELARIRLVDTDDLPTLGQLLPAFVTAENLDHEVAGLDVEDLTRTGEK
ncbi:hypothetical protein LJR130_007093 [Variovorax sp. LjRoot130]|uniref:hypothetical protein n=1 Tax=Variovorax sp. LjRoot130 TaxID=3342261 RepID=UPI003ECF970E